MTSDERALMSAILADPADDTPRLQLADWLEEQGDSDRAEFIRVQCALAEHAGRGIHGTLIHDDWQRLRERERELFNPDWFRIDGVPGGAGLDFDWNRFAYSIPDPSDSSRWLLHAPIRRGFIAEVHCTLQAWMGGECDCDESRHCGKRECLGRWDFDDPDYCTCDCDECDQYMTIKEGKDCSYCQGTGTIPGHGPAIVSRHPVERVVLSDLRPRQSGVHWCWYMDDMPKPLLELVRLAVRDAVSGAYSSLSRLSCITEQAARDALSVAAIAWAKQQNAQTPTG